MARDPHTAIVEITPPEIEPVSLEEARISLRVDGNEDDSRILDLIVAARVWIENYCGRAFPQRTIEAQLDHWAVPIILPKPPCQSVISIKYLDHAGLEQILDPSLYVAVIGRSPAIIIRKPGSGEWPTLFGVPAQVRVRYVAGYATGAIPSAVKVAMLQWMADHYDGPSTQGRVAGLGVSESVKRILDPLRVPGL